MEGAIVASFITSGFMSADRLQGGTLKIGGINNINGEILVVDAEGNDLVKIGIEGITLSNGTKLIGGNGVLSNFKFDGKCSANGDMLGFIDYNDDNLTKTKILIDAYIPENFEIVEAKVVLTHSPIFYTKGDLENVLSFWGYARKLRISKVTNLNFKRVAGLYSEYADSEDIEFEDTVGFNGGIFNPHVPSNADYRTETVVSLNLKDYLNTGNNVLMIDSEEDAPAKVGDFIEKEGYSRIGQVKATLNVVGYMK